MPPSAEYRGERGKEKQESHNTHVSPARSGGTHSSSFSDVQPTSRVWKVHVESLVMRNGGGEGGQRSIFLGYGIMVGAKPGETRV